MDPTDLNPQDWLRFVHLDPFPGQCSRLGLTDDDLRGLEIAIMVAPTAGTPVRGTGGVRKLRFSFRDSDRGKSGAYRVFYKHFPEYGTVILWAIISKGQSDNLSKADRNAIAKQVERLQRLLDQGAIQ